ncbi:hypothetical protein SAMN05444320_102321 [Streptoalloteichus hindustanus]|uniref:DUF5753 domain-containing protein n=2 Tax=Streptoalloteichus hindustanus TaxID=2017 RepID=A0A1M4YE62_STRHI|nr:hypothetical protein SAMN05444320_102321 [Streptoalloteichus hindustanus]
MHELNMSRAKVYRIENTEDATKVSLPDVIALCQLYSAPAEIREQLLELARAAVRRGWWSSYVSALTGWFVDYVSLEAEATSVFEFEIDAIPGLLQTERYARQVISAWAPDLDPAVLDARVAVRMKRQSRLLEGMALTVVLDEYALSRPIGGPEQMQAQLRHLLDVTTAPNIVLQVLPTAVGAHAALATPYTLLRFPISTPIVYMDTLTGGIYVDEAPDVARYETVAEQLSDRALDVDESRRVVECRLKELE